MEQLNVMIVDDETHIRNGLKVKVNWQDLGMRVTTEASDGAEALSYIQKGKIDLVITDINMPIMDGLRFIEKAVEINRTVKFIIISGYSEFEYARTAMKFGISEYLLKPLKDTEIQASLLKIREEISLSETSWLKERAKKEHSRRKEEFLLHWLTDNQPQSSSADLEGDMMLEPCVENFLIGVMKTEQHEASNESVHYLRNLTRDYDIETACNSLLAELGRGSIIKSIQPEHDFILLLHPDSVTGQEKIIFMLNTLLGELVKKLGLRATIGLGRTYAGAHCIKLSYREALFAIKERILYGRGMVINYANIPVKSDKPKFSSETRLLARFLKDRKWQTVKEHIDHMFRHSIQKKIIVNHIEVYELFFEIYFVIKQFSQEEASNQEFTGIGTEVDITEIVRGFSHSDQMVDWLYQYTEAVCHHLKEGQDVTGKDIVYRVADYIKEFCSSDLTLNLVAEKYHINPIYFSRIFKTYIGESFNNYITRIRMEEAKNLMETTSLKMQEISGIVGYEDPKYFSKVFKKHFGISPSLYSDIG